MEIFNSANSIKLKLLIFVREEEKLPKNDKKYIPFQSENTAFLLKSSASFPHQP